MEFGSIQEIMEYAVSKEIEAAEFYEGLSRQEIFSGTKKTFEDFAKEERKHQEMLENSDRVITIGCGVEDVCPAAFVPAEDWQLEDPEGKPIEKVRGIRDKIKFKVKKLIEEIQQSRR